MSFEPTHKSAIVTASTFGKTAFRNTAIGDSNMSYGVIHYMLTDAFHNPERGLSYEARVERLLDKCESEAPPIQTTNGWPRIKEAIQRGSLFVLEAAAPGTEALLRFDPKAPTSGSYEIRTPHQKTETGATVKVIEIDPKDLHQERFSMLKPYPYRYVIVTAANDRARTHKTWRVGLTEFRAVPETEQSEEPTGP